MTCRVVRLSQDPPHGSGLLLECGSADVEVCYSSKTLGLHLCPTCAQSMVECGTTKENQMRSPKEEAACSLSQSHHLYLFTVRTGVLTPHTIAA